MGRYEKTTLTYCPVCNEDTAQVVKDSRPTTFGDHAVIRRRRVCNGCDGKFTTLELPTTMLDDTKMRAEILKSVFDKIYAELMFGAPTLNSRYSMKEGE